MVSDLIFITNSIIKAGAIVNDETYDFGEKIIVDDMLIANNIYVDIEFLKYIQLGTILSHKDLNEYQYTAIYRIITNDAFKERYTDDVSVIFKSVENISDLLKSDKGDDIVFTMSPSLEPAINIIRHVIKMSDQSKRFTNNTAPTKLFIDTGILELSENMCNHISKAFGDIFQMDVQVLSKGLEAFEDTLKFDVYFVSNLSRFNATMLDHLNAERCVEKNIFCSKLLPLSRLPDLTSEEIPATLMNINLVMSAATKFHFVNPFTCLT